MELVRDKVSWMLTKGVSSGAMNSASIVDAAELERETGLGKDLLRKWRSRYGFPTPLPSNGGGYGYPREQIAQLRLIKRLQNVGYRARQVVGKSLEELQQLALVAICASDDLPELTSTRQALDLLKQFDLAGLDAFLGAERQRQSLHDFVVETVSPLVTGLGEAWARGEIEVYHEHLCTGILSRRLFMEIGAALPKPGYPRILFATPSDELHVLGLYMAQAVLADAGASCTDIGPHVPPNELAAAARASQAEIVALSFSFSYPEWRVRPLLTHLRQSLPATVELWAGGAGVAFIKRAPRGVHIFSDLNAAVAALARIAKKTGLPARTVSSEPEFG